MFVRTETVGEMDVAGTANVGAEELVATLETQKVRGIVDLLRLQEPQAAD